MGSNIENLLQCQCFFPDDSRANPCRIHSSLHINQLHCIKYPSWTFQCISLLHVASHRFTKCMHAQILAHRIYYPISSAPLTGQVHLDTWCQTRMSELANTNVTLMPYFKLSLTCQTLLPKEGERVWWKLYCAVQSNIFWMHYVLTNSQWHVFVVHSLYTKPHALHKPHGHQQ